MVEQIAVGSCERLISAAVGSCPVRAQQQTAPAEHRPDFDALALAVAQQTNFIGEAAILIGAIGLLAAVGWGVWVIHWAEKAAKKTAEDWLEKNAGPLIDKFARGLYSSPQAGPGAGVSGALTPSQQANELEAEGEALAQRGAGKD